MLPQECREAFLVQTMHPYFQLTKREKGVSAACASVGWSWQERQREREKKKCVSSRVAVLKRTVG